MEARKRNRYFTSRRSTNQCQAAREESRREGAFSRIGKILTEDGAFIERVGKGPVRRLQQNKTWFGVLYGESSYCVFETNNKTDTISTTKAG